MIVVDEFGNRAFRVHIYLGQGNVKKDFADDLAPMLKWLIPYPIVHMKYNDEAYFVTFIKEDFSKVYEFLCKFLYKNSFNAILEPLGFSVKVPTANNKVVCRECSDDLEKYLENLGADILENPGADIQYFSTNE